MASIFLRYVRDVEAAQPPALHEDNTTTTFVLDPAEPKLSSPAPATTAPYDGTPGLAAEPLASCAAEHRRTVRTSAAALAELADGLLALHAAGKELHRDVKPRNGVLVTKARPSRAPRFRSGPRTGHLEREFSRGRRDSGHAGLHSPRTGGREGAGRRPTTGTPSGSFCFRL